MEPLNDDELSRILRQWEAPGAPASLEKRVMRRGEPWWRWLLTGSVRIPVPLGIAAAVAIVWALAVGLRPQPAPPAQPVQVASFEPVRELKPRIIRSVYAID